MSREPAERAFLAVYARAFVHPQRAMAALLAGSSRLRWGAYSVAIAASTYLLVYFFLSQNGGRPTVFAPWLAIPAEAYYRFNVILHVPSVLLAWIAAAGSAQLIARAVGGVGTFEDTLAVFGLGIGVATWATGLHDLVTTGLGYLGTLDQRVYEDAMSTPGTGPHFLIWTLMTIYLIGLLVLFACGIAVAHRVRWPRATAVGAAGLVVYQTVFAIFNR